MITGTSNYDEVPTIPCKICGGYFKADDPESHKCEGQPNEQHRQTGATRALFTKTCA